MKDRRRLSAILGVCAGAAWLWAAGCGRAPKYAKYVSPFKDFTCEMPTDWPVILDSSDKNYYEILFTGPFEGSFFHGVPSLSIRWYRYNTTHHLPGGGYEIYKSSHDFTNQMLRDVYGPDGYFKGGSDKEQEAALARGEELKDVEPIYMSDKKLLGYYFVAYHNAQARPKDKDGVVVDEKGNRIVRQRHGYVILPLKFGFYVLTYPATYDGYEKYRPEFFRLINTLRFLRAGPA